MIPMDHTTKSLDVLIVGAGFSGIAAAKKLYENGLDFKILEARDRLGGRVFTKKLADDLYLDYGGQWIGEGQSRMYELCEEYGLRYFETFDAGDNILSLHNKTKKYKGLIPALDLLSLFGLHRIMSKLEKLAKTVPLDNPWTHPDAKVLDKCSLGGFLNKYSLTKNSHKVIRAACETIFAADPDKISLLHALFYIKSGRSLKTLISIKDGAQQHRLVDGMQSLAEKIAGPFKEKITFNQPVENIAQEDQGVIISGKNFTYRAKKAIIAIPPPMAAAIRFYPPLSEKKKEVLEQVFMGNVGKCFMVYQKAFWRDKNFSGQILADEHSPFQTMFDNSPQNGHYGIILAFTIGERAEKHFQKGKTEREMILKKKLMEYFGSEAGNNLFYEDFTMSEEPFSKGCYAGIYPQGTWTSIREDYSKTEGHIHWAGTEASSIWYGYIEGAVRAGEKAAENILGLM